MLLRYWAVDLALFLVSIINVVNGTKRYGLYKENLKFPSDVKAKYCQPAKQPLNDAFTMNFKNFCYHRDISYRLKVTLNGSEQYFGLNLNSPISWVVDEEALIIDRIKSDNISNRVFKDNYPSGISCEWPNVDCGVPDSNLNLTVQLPENTFSGSGLKAFDWRPYKAQHRDEARENIPNLFWLRITDILTKAPQSLNFDIAGEMGLGLSKEMLDSDFFPEAYQQKSFGKFSIYLRAEDGYYLYKSIIFDGAEEKTPRALSGPLTWITSFYNTETHLHNVLLKTIQVDMEIYQKEEENSEKKFLDTPSKNKSSILKVIDELGPVTYFVLDSSSLTLAEGNIAFIIERLNSEESKANCVVEKAKKNSVRCKNMSHPLHFSSINLTFSFAGNENSLFALPIRYLIDTCKPVDDNTYDCYLKLHKSLNHLNFLGEAFFLYFYAEFDLNRDKVGIAIASDLEDSPTDNREDNPLRIRQKEINQELEYIFISLLGFSLLIFIALCAKKKKIRNCLKNKRKKRTKITKKEQETEISSLGVSRDDSDVSQFVNRNL
jgi:hypothetical protein